MLLESAVKEMTVWQAAFAGKATLEAPFRPYHVVIPESRKGGRAPQTCFRVVGDSMIGDGIHDGNTVFVRTDLEPTPGKIVAIRTPDGVMLKRVSQCGDMLKLESSNPAHGDAFVSIDDVCLIGLVVGVYKDL